MNSAFILVLAKVHIKRNYQYVKNDIKITHLKYTKCIICVSYYFLKNIDITMKIVIDIDVKMLFFEKMVVIEMMLLRHDII